MSTDKRSGNVLPFSRTSVKSVHDPEIRDTATRIAQELTKEDRDYLTARLAEKRPSTALASNRNTPGSYLASAMMKLARKIVVDKDPANDREAYVRGLDAIISDIEQRLDPLLPATPEPRRGR